MRVLQVIPGLGAGGGAERSLEAIAPRLTEKVELHVVAFEDRQAIRASLERAGVVVHHHAVKSRLEALRVLDQVIRSVKPDLVHTTLIDADLVGRLAAIRRRVPVVSSLVSVNYGRQEFSSEGLKLRVRRLAVWLADAATARMVVSCHALTNHVADTMSKRLLVRRGRMQVIARGREPSVLGMRSAERGDRARRALAVGHAPLIVVAARHERPKGLDVLIQALPMVWREVPDAQVLIGGRDGLESARLRELHGQLPTPELARFIGQRDDVAELMCAADVWCVPSRWEGFCSILLEAMAVEVPVVASDLPAIREVAGNPPVFELVAPEDPAALARGIVRLLKDRARAEANAGAARQRFLDEFTVDVVAEAMNDFYVGALGRSRIARRSR